MKLKSIQVKNYRCVEDSEKFSVDDIICLVGKNESGKTAILKAIEGIKPFDQNMKYDKTTDYPRRHLNEYEARHNNSHAEVCVSEWKLDPKDVAALDEEFGQGCLNSEVIIVHSYYERGKIWKIELDEQRVVTHLCDEQNLNAVEQKVVSKASTTEELYEKISNNSMESEKLNSIIERIGEYREQSAKLHAVDILSERMPSFVYFSHYSRMSGQVSIDKYRQDKANNNVDEGDKIFGDFLAFAGTSVDEIEEANKHEEFKSKIESASNAITDQIFDYWTQNRNLEIEFEPSEGKSGDPSPFNSGTVMRARVRNTVHRASVPFSERSAGFVWFFSFLVHFSQVKKHYTNQDANVIVLLDEPGLTLHAKAQHDLLKYIQGKLAPNHQVIYSTHSPFMVIPEKLTSIRTVEDVVIEKPNERPNVLGTKVSTDFLKTSRDTIFPLQSALGYEISQTLFIGKNVVLVEGPSDILYLKTISNILKAKDRNSLSEKWVICPAGSIDKIAPFINLYLSHGEQRTIVVLTDYHAGEKNKVEKLRNSDMGILLLLCTEFCDKTEADIEDLFEKTLYLQILKESCGIDIEPKNIDDTQRIVKEVERQVDRFSHYVPADWLMRNSDVLRQDTQQINTTLARFESIFIKINENQ